MTSIPEIVFHIGLHKTGTTWLQNRVFAPEHGRSIRYAETRADLRGVFYKPRHDAFSPEAARASLDPILSEARQNGRLLILSDESLAGLPFGDKFRQGVTLGRIRDTFPEAGVLITVREQTRILHSAYGHYLRGGGTATLENFLCQPPDTAAATWDPLVDLDYYDYARLLRHCRRLFMPDRVVMAPMEWMLDDPQGLLARLSDAFGLDWAARQLPDTGAVVNPAWSDLGYALNRRLNHFTTGLPRWTMGTRRLRPNAVAARIDRLTPKNLRTRQKTRQLDTVARAIGDRYAASNAELSEMLKIDLEAYGYVIA